MYTISIGSRSVLGLFDSETHLNYIATVESRVISRTIENRIGTLLACSLPFWEERTPSFFIFATMVQQTDFESNTSHDSTQASVDFDVAEASDGQFENEVQYIEITSITHRT